MIWLILDLISPRNYWVYERLLSSTNMIFNSTNFPLPLSNDVALPVYIAPFISINILILPNEDNLIRWLPRSQAWCHCAKPLFHLWDSALSMLLLCSATTRTAIKYLVYYWRMLLLGSLWKVHIEMEVTRWCAFLILMGMVH